MKRFWLTVGWVVFAGVCAYFMHVALPAHARWENVAQEWEPYNLTPNQKSWFKGVRAGSGVPCCDQSDGHPTDYDIRLDGFWIPDPLHLELPRQWIKIPPEAIIYNAGNPIGEAIVWYVMQGADTVYVRCFVPGGGV
jgi:hypothetical protein